MATHASPTFEDFVGDGADAFRATFDLFPEPLGILASVRDDSGAIVDFLTLWGNQALEELAGMPLNVDPRPLLIADVAPSLRDIGQFDAYCRVVETGIPYADEVEFDGDVGPPGRRITGIFKVGINKLGDGFVAMWRDVTALVRAEEAIEHLAAIVESTDDAIVGADENGIITAWNAGAERLLGWSREEIVGRHVGTIVPREERPTQRARYENLLQGGSVERFETHWVRRDRTLIDVVLTASPVRDRNGTIIGASAVVHDITELKRVQAELTRSNAELEQFVAIAAHDLREPLSSISQFAELLGRFNDDDLDDRGREIIENIQRGTRRARSLLDGLREYSRVGREQPTREAVDLALLLEGLLEMLGPALREARGDRPRRTAPDGPGRRGRALARLPEPRPQRAEVPRRAPAGGSRQGDAGDRRLAAVRPRQRHRRLRARPRAHLRDLQPRARRLRARHRHRPGRLPQGRLTPRWAHLGRGRQTAAAARSSSRCPTSSPRRRRRANRAGSTAERELLGWTEVRQRQRERRRGLAEERPGRQCRPAREAQDDGVLGEDLGGHRAGGQARIHVVDQRAAAARAQRIHTVVLARERGLRDAAREADRGRPGLDRHLRGAGAAVAVLEMARGHAVRRGPLDLALGLDALGVAGRRQPERGEQVLARARRGRDRRDDRLALGGAGRHLDAAAHAAGVVARADSRPAAAGEGDAEAAVYRRHVVRHAHGAVANRAALGAVVGVAMGAPRAQRDRGAHRAGEPVRDEAAAPREVDVHAAAHGRGAAHKPAREPADHVGADRAGAARAQQEVRDVVGAQRDGQALAHRGPQPPDGALLGDGVLAGVPRPVRALALNERARDRVGLEDVVEVELPEVVAVLGADALLHVEVARVRGSPGRTAGDPAHPGRGAGRGIGVEVDHQPARDDDAHRPVALGRLLAGEGRDRPGLRRHEQAAQQRRRDPASYASPSRSH